jgi:predicted short-subunit dehydrogenase-like oxidoreductase (DUF2520 family)
MDIALIGSGNVATHLALALIKHHNIVTVYSRTLENAQILADRINSTATDSIKDLPSEADIYIIAVKDDAIKRITDELSGFKGVIVHTAGSISIDILKSFPKHGVFYPFQTFSKNKEVDPNNIPVLIESNNRDTLQVLRELATSITGNVYEVNSEQRLMLHISAVFACNFVNHFYFVAETILSKAGLPFNLLLPLIDETAHKVHTSSPFTAQTGPASRNDNNTVKKHLKILQGLGEHDLAELYDRISKDITELHHHKKK